MRVLLVSDNYLPNRDGVTSSLVSLAAGLHEFGDEIAIVAPGTVAGSAAVHRTYPVASIRTGYGDWRLSLRSADRFARAVAAFRPDIVHVQTLGPVGLAATAHCARDGIPQVFSWHTDLLAYRDAYPVLHAALPLLAVAGLRRGPMLPVLAAAGRDVAAAAAGRADTARHRQVLADVLSPYRHIIVPSAKAAATLPAPHDHVVTVVPSAPVPPQPLNKTAREQLRVIHSRLARDPHVVVCVGRLSLEKHLDVLLRAMAAEVLPAHPDTRLYLVGAGRQRRRYVRLASDLGITRSVTFMGALSRDMVPHMLGACTVLAHPSLTETQGLVLAEAALVGLPSVIRDLALDGVVVHGETGYIAEDDASFGRHISRLIADSGLREALGARAQRIARRYTSRAFADRVRAVYWRVLRPTAPAT